MYLDLIGRVQNTKLPATKPLQPLFEAISNSFDAIEDGHRGDGTITVVVDRDESKPALLDEDREVNPVAGFRVIDNGIGFNEENFLSFNTSDTLYKKPRGGKGVGRLVWLKALEKVEISSVYLEANQWCRRSFDFTLSPEGVQGEVVGTAAAAKEPQTSVKLVGLKPGYQKYCPKSHLIIGELIVEHFLSHFFGERCPRLVLVDGGDSLDLNAVFHDTFGSVTELKSFSVKAQKFTIRHLHLHGGRETREHRVHLCANERQVESEAVGHLVREMPRGRLRDQGGTEFVYVAHISGAYLDESVNPERTGFLFPARDAELEREFPDAVSREGLLQGAGAEIEVHLTPFLGPLREEKIERIETFVKNKAPQYRPVLKHKPEALAEISPDVRDEEGLDSALRRIAYRLEEELRDTQRQLVTTKPDEIADFETYFRKYLEFLDKENDIGKSNLAQYIAHRKAVIEALDRFLGLSDSGKYYREEAVHRFICPLKTTSDDLGFQQHNLWLVDDRLAFHEYLASDLPLRRMDAIESDSLDRPDVIVFNRSHAFAPDTGYPFNSIVILEFKRPERQDYAADDNPIEQAYSYIRKIREAKAKDRRGETISVPPTTPYYVYAICTMTPGLKQQAEDAGLHPTPDSLGYFGYNPNLHAYVEIISYRKLLQDAKARNRVLFEKLSLVP